MLHRLGDVERRGRGDKLRLLSAQILHVNTIELKGHYHITSNGYMHMLGLLHSLPNLSETHLLPAPGRPAPSALPSTNGSGAPWRALRVRQAPKRQCLMHIRPKHMSVFSAVRDIAHTTLMSLLAARLLTCMSELTTTEEQKHV